MAHYRTQALEAADDDYFVASANMKVGAYTIVANHGIVPGGVARNVVATVTKAGALDTPGTLTIKGTDLSGAALTEVLSLAEGAVASARAFKTVTSVTGAGWVIGEGNDTIKVGFGNLIGLPDKLTLSTVLAAYKDGTKESTAPTVTVSSADLALNTIVLSNALNNKIVDIYYLVG